ncbi:tetratricopeptide repeat protein [Agaribacter marinus]|uniref:OmpR/PhoB-type domain-containing protein n=1 Tax=Agaribacter marinus TaxID=1431249 RepID=A0AA37T257_9ALTE|nr:tetratricopeptide repeat protein [Agaribacter marinus]GLR72221.1 hypothetical protein GCM10007852_31290 [Agaribacter marinus]
MIYETGGHFVDANQLTVTLPDGKVLAVRPKTFALLLVFMRKPQTLLSKQLLIDKVWDDVHAQEKNLFQAIAEVREIFKGKQVIKTFPRKGYRWQLAVSSLIEADFSQTIAAKQIGLTEEIATLPIDKSPRARLKLKKAWLAVAAIALAFISALATHYWPMTKLEDKLTTNTVLVLPVRNHIAGSDHLWTYYGLLDQLNSQIQPPSPLRMLSTEFVLQYIDYLNLQRQYSNKDIHKFLQLLKPYASVVAELAGSVGDYQLSYRLIFRDHEKKGVLFGNDLRALSTQLATELSRLLGNDQPDENEARQDFSSTLMATALDYKNDNQCQQAVPLFKSALALNKNNKHAWLLLAQCLIYQHKYQAAENELKQALAYSTPSSPLHPRLLHWLATSHSAQGEFSQAQDNIELSQQLLQSGQDPLYQAYNWQVNGHILAQNRDFSLAQEALDKALALHESIHCPVGQNSVLMQLHQLFLTQNNYAQAKQALDRATQIARDIGLK